MASKYVLAIDQGTTSTRGVIFNEAGMSRRSARGPCVNTIPGRGGWNTIRGRSGKPSPKSSRLPVQAQVVPAQLAAIGLTNQRETVLLWQRLTGRPVTPALVWQDRRTASFCREQASAEPWLYQRTGLVLDPYFSATKLHWLLQNDATLRLHAESGRLAMGTIDSWLLWNLTGGQVHATDFSNASRTLLLNLHTASWDAELCRFFQIPPAILPSIQPSVSRFGTTAALPLLPAGIPITGIAGDQQAALFGQGGFAAGDAKCTYGTGAFFLVHTGAAKTFRASAPEQSGGDDRRDAAIRPRRQRFHRGGGGAMAARRVASARRRERG